ncbi:MAG: DUF58 domain-containing protein [Fibrobacterota bacterium]
MLPRDVLKAVRRIEIKTASIVDSLMGGEYKTVFRGNGMEFAEVRPYIEGDDIRSIDWNVTARMGEPYIKKNVEERELTVLLAVDVSASGEFGTVNSFKSRMIAELGALLSLSATRNNDQVGLLLFTDRVEKFIPPRKGRRHALQLIRELLYFEPVSRGTDITAALEYLNSIQKKRAVTFLISDFYDEGYINPLKATSRRHDLVTISAHDPREYDLPPMGLVQLRDAETGEVYLADTSSRSFRREYRRRAARRRSDLSDLFRRYRIDHLEVNTETGYVEPLIRFFHRRERRR